MKFEEQFPTLKGKILHLFEGYESCWLENSDDGLFGAGDKTEQELFILIEDLRKYCLDKQKVREVIKKFWNLLSKNNPNTLVTMEGMPVDRWFEKELGL